MIRWSILACINFLTSVIIRCAAAMRELEYNEDSSASCLPDCQGTYKSQHDTSQNLKYFYVFPKVAALEGGGGGGGGGKSSSSSSTSADAGPSLDTTSKEYLVVTADASTFQEMVQRKVTSWSQKKKLLELLKEKAEEFITISNKAMTGNKLNPLEEEISNANSGCDEEKITWLQSEIKGMVEKGQLTEKEKTEVLRYFFLYSSCQLKENQCFETESYLSILYFSSFLFLFPFLFLNAFVFNM